MGDIYRGLQCTISITDAGDADGGIFSRRNPLFHIPLRIGHTSETPVSVPPSVPNLESSSLSTRAWTFPRESFVAEGPSHEKTIDALGML